MLGAVKDGVDLKTNEYKRFFPTSTELTVF